MPRQTKYIRDGWNEKLGVVQGWARDGLTDKQIADKMGIGVRTLYDYKNRYEQFSQALKKGKNVIDRQVENALLKRALGYEYTEVTEENGVETKRVTKEVKPDTTAQIFWLKNRKPKEWRNDPQPRDEKNIPLAGLTKQMDKARQRVEGDK